MGVTSAKSQSRGRDEVRRDCVNMDCRIGARMVAQVLRKKGGILSGPGALVTSRVSSSLRIPSVEMSKGASTLRAGRQERLRAGAG